MERIKNKKLMFGHILALFSMLVWGTTFIATKLLLKHFTSLEIMLFRFLLGYIALFAASPKIFKFTNVKHELLFFIASLSGISLYQYLENVSLETANAANVSIITSCAAFFTAILSKIFLKDEEINKFFFIGFVISISGVVMVSIKPGESTGSFGKGDLIAFFASILWGLYSVMVKIVSKHNYTSLQVTRRVMFYGTIVLVPFCIFTKADLSLGRFTDMSNLFLMLFLGIVASAICFFTWNLAVEYLGAVRTGMYIYFNPIITIIFGIIILGENLTLLGGIGTIFILGGLYVSSIKKNKMVLEK